MMPTVPLIEESAAPPAARAGCDDKKTSRNTDWINNLLRALANQPPTLKRTWESLKEVMRGLYRARGSGQGQDEGQGIAQGVLPYSHTIEVV
jgi:hypothetical protein